MPFVLIAICAMGTALSLAQADPADPDADIEVVFASVRPGYHRPRLPDGHFAAQTYRMNRGDYWGSFIADDAREVHYGELQEAVAHALAPQAFLPAPDGKDPDLIIDSDWGTMNPPPVLFGFGTVVDHEMPDSPGLLPDIGGVQAESENWQETEGAKARLRPPGDFTLKIMSSLLRDSAWEEVRMTNVSNAKKLGYGNRQDPDLRADRSFIVLRAYDFREWKKGRRRTPLWEVHVSVRGGRMVDHLGALAWAASQFAGRDSKGRALVPPPEGEVFIGPVRSLGALERADRVAMDPDGGHVAYLHRTGSRLRLEIATTDSLRHVATEDLPDADSRTARLFWDGPQRVVAVLSTGIVSFDAAGNRQAPGASSATPAAEEAPAMPSGPEAAQVKAEVERQIPHREIAVAGADRSGTHYLVVASDGSGRSRYLVLDRTNDLLVEVGGANLSP